MSGKAKYEVDLSTFGGRVRECRNKLGLTQDELAERCGYNSRSTINGIELGKNDVPLKKVSIIADALGVTPAYLIFGEAEVETETDIVVKDEITDLLVEMTPNERDVAKNMLLAYFNAINNKKK